MAVEASATRRETEADPAEEPSSFFTSTETGAATEAARTAVLHLEATAMRVGAQTALPMKEDIVDDSCCDTPQKSNARDRNRLSI